MIKLASQSFAWRLLNQDKTDGDMKAIEAKLLDAISIFNVRVPSVPKNKSSFTQIIINPILDFCPRGRRASPA